MSTIEALLTPLEARLAVATIEHALAAGEPSERSAKLVEVIRGALGVHERTEWPDVAALAAAFPDARSRRFLVDGLVIAACIECEVHEHVEREVRRIAAALDVESPWVALLPSLRRRRVLDVKRALFSRAPDGRRVLARTWQEAGVRGLWDAALFVAGALRDPLMSARFRALGSLPAGTLGRTFHDDFVARGLAFPGERGALPERMIHHDLMHVINGYGTDPGGESQLAAFYAGHCLRSGIDDWFTFFVIALATFHLDLRVSPSIVTPARGAFDPALSLAAFERGLRVTVDVMGPWDYWALMPLPLPEARRRLGLDGHLVDDESRAA